VADAATQIRGPPSVDDAKLTTFGLRITSPLFIGAGGVGFTVASGTLALAIVTPTAAGDTRSWLAVSASLNGGSELRDYDVDLVRGEADNEEALTRGPDDVDEHLACKSNRDGGCLRTRPDHFDRLFTPFVPHSL